MKFRPRRKNMAAKKGSTAETAADNEIVITRVVNAPVEKVFQAMIDPKQVSKWWGPTGFTDTIHEMDVRVGGVWKHTMHGPDGTNYPNKSIFKEIVKNERVVYALAGGNENGGGAHFEASWNFEAQGNKTKLTIRMVFPTAAVREHVVKTYNAI